MKILLIEDYPSARELLRVLLEAENYEVIEAADGRTGIELALEELPDLVILDLMLPEVEGERVIRELQKSEDFAGTPILVVSAKSEALDDLRDALGDENVFSKPFEPTKLLDRVGVLLGHPGE